MQGELDQRWEQRGRSYGRPFATLRSVWEIGKEVVRGQGKPAPNRLREELRLSVGGNEAPRPAAILRIRPAMDARHIASSHVGNGLEAAAELDNSVSWFHAHQYCDNRKFWQDSILRLSQYIGVAICATKPAWK